MGQDLIYVQRNKGKKPELYLLNCHQKLPLSCAIAVVGIKGRASVMFHICR